LIPKIPASTFKERSGDYSLLNALTLQAFSRRFRAVFAKIRENSMLKSSSLFAVAVVVWLSTLRFVGGAVDEKLFFGQSHGVVVDG